MIRLIDIFLSLIGIIILLPLMFFILLVGFFESNSPIFKQHRVGLNQNTFLLIKFRTMKTDTFSVATHLIDSSKITNFGKFLRKTKIDEIPQLFNVLKGDMSLVGPRPCLLNQLELIKERNKMNVFKVRPGITGLSQISGVNMQTPALLAKTDSKMIESFNLFYYFLYIFKTLLLLLKKSV